MAPLKKSATLGDSDSIDRRIERIAHLKKERDIIDGKIWILQYEVNQMQGHHWPFPLEACQFRTIVFGIVVLVVIFMFWGVPYIYRVFGWI